MVLNRHLVQASHCKYYQYIHLGMYVVMHFRDTVGIISTIIMLYMIMDTTNLLGYPGVNKSAIICVYVLSNNHIEM